jgi:hypothetical protein
MAYLARRYGRDGLHFVIAGSLESTGNELRRRIQSNNYGIGLRTGQSLDALRVSRRPAGLQDKELNVGRGYLVKSGQASLVQVASPYEIAGPAEGQEPEVKNAAALDHWIDLLCARHPGPRAAWSAAKQDGKPAASPAAGVVADPQTAKLLDLLHRAALKRAAPDEAAIVATWSVAKVLYHYLADTLEADIKTPASVFGESIDDIILFANEHFPKIRVDGTAKEDSTRQNSQATAQQNGPGSKDGDKPA